MRERTRSREREQQPQRRAAAGERDAFCKHLADETPASCAERRLTELPKSAPDSPVTTIAIECDGEPMQDTDYVRKNRERDKA